jgi:CRP-like cAMP-binding protein
MYDTLKSIFLFEHLNDCDIRSLRAISKLKTHLAGEILFFEGDTPNKLFILTQGIVKLYKTDMKGNPIVLHHLNAVCLVAEMANLHNTPFPASAQLETDATVIEIDYTPFKEDFLSNPTISFEIIKSLTQKIKFLESAITSHLTLDSTSRVAKMLYENENFFHTMKQRKVASALNMTPETLSRIFRKFKNLGLISEAGKEIQILNKKGLLELFT